LLHASSFSLVPVQHILHHTKQSASSFPVCAGFRRVRKIAKSYC